MEIINYSLSATLSHSRRKERQIEVTDVVNPSLFTPLTIFSLSFPLSPSTTRHPVLLAPSHILITWSFRFHGLPFLDSSYPLDSMASAL